MPPRSTRSLFERGLFWALSLWVGSKPNSIITSIYDHIISYMSYVTQMSAVQASAVIVETAATTLGSSERGFISTCNLDEQATLYLEINQGLGDNTQQPWRWNLNCWPCFVVDFSISPIWSTLILPLLSEVGWLRQESPIVNGCAGVVGHSAWWSK